MSDSDFKTEALKAVQQCRADGRDIFEIVMGVAHDMKVEDAKEVERVARWAGSHLALERHVRALEANGKPVNDGSLGEAKRRIDRQFTLAETKSKRTAKSNPDRPKSQPKSQKPNR